MLNISNYCKQHRLEIVLLLLLIILSFITRFHNINDQILWWDELGTHYFGKMSFFDNAKTDNNSPTYYLLEGTIEKIFGKTEFAIKFVSALFGALSVPLMYLVSNKLFKNKPVSLFASLLMLLSPIMIIYSQEARGYSIGLFFFLLGLYCFLLLMSDNHWALWCLFALNSAISIHMHYVFAIPIAILMVFSMMYSINKWYCGDKKIIKKMTACFILFIALMVPILYGFIFAYNLSVNFSDSWYTEWSLVKLTLSEFLFRNSGIEFILLTMVIIGTTVLFLKQRSQCVLLLSLTLIPLIYFFIISPNTHVHPRYMIYLAPILYLLAAASILSLADKKTVETGLVLVCSFIIIFAVVPQLDQYYTEDSYSGSMKQLSEIIEDEITEEDCIVYSQKWLYWGFEGGLSFYYDSDNKTTPIYGIDNLEQLNEIMNDRKTGHIFLLLYGGDDVYQWAENSDKSEVIIRGCAILYKITI